MNAHRLCCICTDGQGKIKSAYGSVNRAKSTASFIWKKERVKLDVYECPHYQGWHLSKSFN